MGMGALGLGTLMAQTGLLAPAARAGGAINPLAPKAPHFPARAKRVIHIFLNGGPSHVDTFDQSRRSISTPTNRCRPAIYPLSARPVRRFRPRSNFRGTVRAALK